MLTDQFKLFDITKINIIAYIMLVFIPETILITWYFIKNNTDEI
jgi:hypothetical protein